MRRQDEHCDTIQSRYFRFAVPISIQERIKSLITKNSERIQNALKPLSNAHWV